MVDDSSCRWREDIYEWLAVTFGGSSVALKLTRGELWVGPEHTQGRESESGLCSQRTSWLDEDCICGDRRGEWSVWLSSRTAFTCFNVSSFARRRRCISTWTALRRRSCAKTSPMLSTPPGSPSNTLSRRPDSRILSPTSAWCPPSFPAGAAPCASCQTAPAAASALWPAAPAAANSGHPHTARLFSVGRRSETTMAETTGQSRRIYNHQSAKGGPHSVFYLFLVNLYFLPQGFDVAAVVLHDCVLLCQFSVLLVNSGFFGNEVTVQLLEHGHERVGLKKVRGRQQLSERGQRGQARERAPALRHCWSVVCLALCLSCRASISLGRVSSSWGSVSTQGGRGGTARTRGLAALEASTETEGIYSTAFIPFKYLHINKHYIAVQMLPFNVKSDKCGNRQDSQPFCRFVVFLKKKRGGFNVNVRILLVDVYFHWCVTPLVPTHHFPLLQECFHLLPPSLPRCKS